MAISTAVKGVAPFKNLIVNGIVLAEDGTKMSKSKKTGKVKYFSYDVSAALFFANPLVGSS